MLLKEVNAVRDYHFHRMYLVSNIGIAIMVAEVAAASGPITPGEPDCLQPPLHRLAVMFCKLAVRLCFFKTPQGETFWLYFLAVGCPSLFCTSGA